MTTAGGVAFCKVFYKAFPCSCCFRQGGQYHGAGVFTGFGLLLRHLAQR